MDEDGEVEDNQVPYFVDYDPFNVYEVTKYDVLVVQLPETIDENEGDIVTVSASISPRLEDWVNFDAESAQFTLKPSRRTREGLSSVEVILSDGTDERQYYISFFVLDAVDPDSFVPDGEGQPNKGDGPDEKET